MKINIETVTIPAGWGCEAFQIGQYPVTVGEWNAVMPDDRRGGDDRHPVTRVNVEDIDKFLVKLNAITGKQYRLPTEIEWCIAVGREPENLADYAVFNAESVAPVGSKLPNEYELYDMRGNVWEWMTTGRRSNRYVLRGGSFVDNRDLARAVFRYRYLAAVRYHDFGFRLFCVLRPPSL